MAIAIRNAAQRSSSSVDMLAQGPAASPVHMPGCGGLGGAAAPTGAHTSYGETKLYEEVRVVTRALTRA